MLTVTEFSALTGCPKELSPEMEEFALFSLEMGDYCEERGQPTFPHLSGKDAPLWRVRPIGQTELSLLANRQDRQDRQTEENKRLAKLAEYVERGFAFDRGAMDTPNKKISE